MGPSLSLGEATARNVPYLPLTDDLMDLEDALASLLGVDVDVVSVDGLKERDDHISQEALPL
ncbi:MAG: hypothetical protein KDB86_09950 [Actinobacteria bacterium]|nr:hypothetical protein [Actinomycetota bacterium]MCB9390213.1 hypothetical protein [Acidimicrobiia bacterium]